MFDIAKMMQAAAEVGPAVDVIGGDIKRIADAQERIADALEGIRGLLSDWMNYHTPAKTSDSSHRPEWLNGVGHDA